ncbi:MAG: hypothetical protein EOP38_08705 [Rubrivivax sp.]|nr:MAG: hypothetical protein EOP38_08705 [Rubrivivax sp.]
MRVILMCILGLAASATQAAQPDCLPATWALSSVPVGTPVERHVDRPTLFMSSNHGLAAYWFCRIPTDGGISYWEVHGTPKAILEAGGASVLEMLYIKDRDGSLSKLAATPCNRPDISDPDERQLCRELLDEVRAQWPKPLASQSR